MGTDGVHGGMISWPGDGFPASAVLAGSQLADLPASPIQRSRASPASVNVSSELAKRGCDGRAEQRLYELDGTRRGS